MNRLSAFAMVLCAAFATPGAAQECSHLGVSGTGHHGTMMKFSLTKGTANAPAFMMVGMELGQTRFDFGMMGSLQLGLGGMLYLVPMGTTNAAGGVHMNLQVPGGMMHRIQMYGQGFMFMLHRGNHHHHSRFEFCTSNVMGFHVGGRHGG